MKNLTIIPADQNERRIARESCGAHTTCPVDVIDGSLPPHLLGDEWHYETRGGQRIHYPSAYAKRGFSNMVYIHSSLRVVVGDQWLADHAA